MSEVDISGLDKKALLRALWEHAAIARFFGPDPLRSPWGPSQEVGAADALTRYIDYFDGRCIKTDLTGDTTSTHMYNCDAGAGAFEEIVRCLRLKQTKQ